MSMDMRKLIAVLALGSLTGCNACVPKWQMRQTQLKSYQFYQQSQALSGQLAQSQSLNAQLAMEKQQAETRAAQLDGELRISNERLRNLAQERSKLNEEYKHLLTSLPAPGPTGNSAAAKLFEDLCRRHPEFEFDPISGIARYSADMEFASGSNELRPESLRVLQEFAKIMNEAESRQFNVLVVGHTDDEAIVRPDTRAKHETNWELSAHRATAVVRQLAKYGVSEPRLGVAGYNKFQPAAPNTNDSNKQKNRRVEIFVLASDMAIAGRDPGVKR
ncbi:OmpA/MotB family protein [Planctomicrobium sp. SH661]|uniref:OmpA/MotB family protein n=1 Tax=Planctomicrobium sp. SH661 TaxID=3448124 RepID=UPI003F5C218D